jgi:DNA-binding GntR family transcriptional regulator
LAPRASAWGVYRTIADSLRVRIAGGEFSPGGPFPSEAMFAAEYGVSRNTMRRALGQLAAERLITAKPGRGRVVLVPGEVQDTTPKYRQITADLRATIETGALRPGDVLPSEAVIMARYGVARDDATGARRA